MEMDTNCKLTLKVYTAIWEDALLYYLLKKKEVAL